MIFRQTHLRYSFQWARQPPPVGDPSLYAFGEGETSAAWAVEVVWLSYVIFSIQIAVIFTPV